MRRKFHTLDVFTDTPLEGNPLAVVLDAEGLDTARMQAIAREFNLSETVFVVDPVDPVNTARLRIFTPARELPFAGHPTVGSAVLIAETRAPEMLGRHDIGLVLEEQIGLVACTVRHPPGQPSQAYFTLPQLPQAGTRTPDSKAVAAALGLSAGDVGFDTHEPSFYSAGVEFAFVPVRDREVLASVRADLGKWEEAFGSLGAYIYTRDVERKGSAFRARMLAHRMGVAEDPATGSAAAAFAGVVMAADRPMDGDHSLRIEQGFEMGRPSLINLGLEVEGGKLVSASIGGAAVMVQQGFIDA